MGVGKEVKTEFPSNCNDDTIKHYVSVVATDPNSIRGVGKYDSPYAIEIRERISIRVYFYPICSPKSND